MKLLYEVLVSAVNILIEDSYIYYASITVMVIVCGFRKGENFSGSLVR